MDIIPKAIPKYNFNLAIHESSLSTEQIQNNRKSIENISKEFRLKTAQLYLKITNEEFDFEREKLSQILNDFPQSTAEMVYTNTKVVQTEEVGTGTIDTESTIEVLHQEPETDIISRIDLFKRYVQYSHKKAELETEYERLFLDERSVKEPPFELQTARTINPVLRKDFLLQV